MKPRLIGEEPDYIAPYNPRTRLVRSREECRLPKPKADKPKASNTRPSHVAAMRTYLYRRWIAGTGWDHRRRYYSIDAIIRRVWSERQHHALPGDPHIHRLLRRARIDDPYCVRKDRWAIRRLTAKEMRRVVECAAKMRAEKALARER